MLLLVHGNLWQKNGKLLVSLGKTVPPCLRNNEYMYFTLMPNDFEHTFQNYVSFIRTYCFENFLFRCIAHIFIELFVFLEFVFQNSLCILFIKPPSDIAFLPLFSSDYKANMIMVNNFSDVCLYLIWKNFLRSFDLLTSGILVY